MVVGERILGTGQILVSAVTDERIGIVNAVPSIEAFFLSRDMFPKAFVEAGAESASAEVATVSMRRR